MTDKTSLPVKEEKGIRHWDPFQEFQEIQDAMARLWNETWPFAFRRSTWPTPRIPALTTTYVPRMDVYEKNGNLIIKADLPGTTPEDVDVTVEDGDLIIRGERKAENEVREEDYYRMERSYGGFYRRQPLPEGITPEQIHATFANGVLEVTIPKPTEKKPAPQKIQVNTR